VFTHRPFHIDASLCLIDVGSGSDTRLMVKQVLEWSKKESLDGKVFGDVHFMALKRLNTKF
jgi:phosphomevalonate kinase